MSYDHWLIPARLADDPHAAFVHADEQIKIASPATPDAASLAYAITAKNAPLDDDTTFLSVHPLEGTGELVFVPSPFPRIQDARDVIVPLAFDAGYAVLDPQLGLVLDPRGAMHGTFEFSGAGTFPTITPALVDRFVADLRVDEFVIVETGAHTYIQTKCVAASEFVLEYRAGSPDAHFATTVTTATQVAAAVHGWLAGDDSPYRDYRWEKVDF